MTDEIQYFATGILAMLIAYVATMVITTKLPDNKEK